MCADSVSVLPCVTAMARKRPRSFCQKCRWQINLNTHTPDPRKSEWAEYAAVQAECGNLSGNELTRNSSGNTWSQSSQLAEPLRTDPGLKKGISVHELISTLTTATKKAQAGNDLSNILPKSSLVRKKPLPPMNEFYVKVYTKATEAFYRDKRVCESPLC